MVQVLSPTDDIFGLQAVLPCLRTVSCCLVCQGSGCSSQMRPACWSAHPRDNSVVQPRQLTLLLLATHLGTW